MEHIAEQLGKDPLDIKKLNLYKKNDVSHSPKNTFISLKLTDWVKFDIPFSTPHIIGCDWLVRILPYSLRNTRTSGL